MSAVYARQVGWARDGFAARRSVLRVLRGSPFVGRRQIATAAAQDVTRFVTAAARSIAADGLTPPWRAAPCINTCTCPEQAGWTQAQAVRRMAAEHNVAAAGGHCAARRVRILVTGTAASVRYVDVAA